MPKRWQYPALTGPVQQPVPPLDSFAQPTSQPYLVPAPSFAALASGAIYIVLAPPAPVFPGTSVIADPGAILYPAVAAPVGGGQPPVPIFPGTTVIADPGEILYPAVAEPPDPKKRRRRRKVDVTLRGLRRIAKEL